MQSPSDVEITSYLALVEQAHAELFGPQRPAWLDRLEREYHQLRAVLHRLQEGKEAEKGLRLAIALREFWLASGRVSEGRYWLAVFLAFPLAAVRPAIRARALDVAGALAFWQSDQAMAQAWMAEGLAIRREMADRLGIAVSLIHLGMNKWIFESNYPAARALYEESLAIYQELDNKVGIANVRQHLANLALVQGEYVAAYSLLKNSLLTLRDEQELWSINFALDSLAGVAVNQRQVKRALRLAGASEALREAIGVLLPPVWQAWIEGLLEPAWQMLDENSGATAWAEGWAMSVEQAVCYALEDYFALEG